MKKKENLLINGCSRGIGYDLFNALKLKYNVFGLSSIKSKKNNVFYYNPIINPRLDDNLLKIIKGLEIDHVIHCSGGGLKYYDKFLELHKLLDLFNINFFSIYEINKELIKNKKKQKKLNIIMIGSSAIFETRASIGYSAAKSILVNYNKNFFDNSCNKNNRILSENPAEQVLLIYDTLIRSRYKWDKLILFGMVNYNDNISISIILGCLYEILFSSTKINKNLIKRFSF